MCNILRTPAPEWFSLGSSNGILGKEDVGGQLDKRLERFGLRNSTEISAAGTPAAMIMPAVFRSFVTGQFPACLRLMPPENSLIGHGTVICIQGTMTNHIHSPRMLAGVT